MYYTYLKIIIIIRHNTIRILQVINEKKIAFFDIIFEFKNAQKIIIINNFNLQTI